MPLPRPASPSDAARTAFQLYGPVSLRAPRARAGPPTPVSPGFSYVAIIMCDVRATVGPPAGRPRHRPGLGHHLSCQAVAPSLLDVANASVPRRVRQWVTVGAPLSQLSRALQ